MTQITLIGTMTSKQKAEAVVGATKAVADFEFEANTGRLIGISGGGIYIDGTNRGSFNLDSISLRAGERGDFSDLTDATGAVHALIGGFANRIAPEQTESER